VLGVPRVTHKKSGFPLPRTLPRAGILFGAQGCAARETAALGQCPRCCKGWETPTGAESRKLVIHFNSHFQSGSFIPFKAGLQSLAFSLFYEKACVILIHVRGHVCSTESSRVTRVNGVLAWQVQNAPGRKALGPPLGRPHMWVALAMPLEPGRSRAEGLRLTPAI